MSPRWTDELLLQVRTDPRYASVVGAELGVSAGRIRQVRNRRLTPQGPWPDELPVWKHGNGGSPENLGAPMYGEENPGHVLTERAVKWIRRTKAKHPDRTNDTLAEQAWARFGLDHVPCDTTISHVLRGSTWKDV